MISSFLPVYRRSDIVMTHGESVYLFDESGKRYLDFAAGIATNSLGHGHPHLVNALKEQAGILWHCSNMYQHPGLLRYSERLVKHTFADTVFFCNSGAEAVECGIKMIRAHFHAAGKPERYRIISMQGAFHGRTMAAISAGGIARTQKNFGPLLEGFDHVPYNDLKAAEAAVTEKTAGILVEAIQGDNGIIPADAEYLRGLRALADKHGLLLFFDEIQAGMGRTGKLFAFEHAGVKVDIVTIAKGMGGGFPLGACLATEHAAKGMTIPGSHGSTYGSNPLAMAVGNAVLDVIMAQGFIENVANIGNYLIEKLQALMTKYPPVIKEVRGKGLLVGIALGVPVAGMVEKLRHAGLLTAPAENNTLRLLPPLIITRAHVDEAVQILEQACKE